MRGFFTDIRKSRDTAKTHIGRVTVVTGWAFLGISSPCYTCNDLAQLGAIGSIRNHDLCNIDSVGVQMNYMADISLFG